MDRLEKIKKKYFYLQVTKHNPDLDWLISKIEQLRKVLNEIDILTLDSMIHCGYCTDIHEITQKALKEGMNEGD